MRGESNINNSINASVDDPKMNNETALKKQKIY